MRLLPKKYERAWEIYGALLFLVFFIVPIPELALPWQAASAAGLVAFIVLYFAAHWLRGPAAFGAVVAVAAIGVALLPVNHGANVFFTYAAALAGLFFPRTAALAFLVAVTAVFAGESSYLGYSHSYILGYGAVTAIVAVIYIQVRQSGRENERLHLREEEIQEVSRHAERQRIALDLHDMLGQSFSLISVKAELSRRLLDIDLPAARRELLELAEAARSSLAAVRETIHGYRQTQLDAELQSASDMLASAGVELVVKRGDMSAEPLVGSFLSLILRECITNVARHARAKLCTVTIGSDGAQTVMEVRDDGVGARRYDGAGVRGMQERARRLGAQLDIDGSQGTRVRVTVPVPAIPAQ